MFCWILRGALPERSFFLSHDILDFTKASDSTLHFPKCLIEAAKPYLNVCSGTTVGHRSNMTNVFIIASMGLGRCLYTTVCTLVSSYCDIALHRISRGPREHRQRVVPALGPPLLNRESPGSSPQQLLLDTVILVGKAETDVFPFVDKDGCF